MVLTRFGELVKEPFVEWFPFDKRPDGVRLETSHVVGSEGGVGFIIGSIDRIQELRVECQDFTLLSYRGKTFVESAEQKQQVR